MTGFAREAGEADWGSWFWEARSVNGRGLDIRIHLPTGWDVLEKPVKAAAGQQLSRGNITLSLKLTLTGSERRVDVNEAALSELQDLYERLEGERPAGAALALLLGIRGVVETDSRVEMPEDIRSTAEDDLLKSAEAVLAELKSDRRQEGDSLRQILQAQLDEMDKMANNAATYAGEQVDLIRERYRTRLAELDNEGAVPEDRIATEVAALAAKGDVTEELDRLRAHISTARALVASSDAVGRKLGFLSQELNREANTLCSKSVSLSLTDAGLALKGIVDQFREQAANVE
jgi:uncharacterized protein (TIGR00255 family)